MTEAERVIRERADRIRDKIVAEILAHHDEITELAVERANTIGEAEYEGRSFLKTGPELRVDRFEEYADAYFYCGVELDMGE